MGPRTRSEHCEEGKILLTLQGNEPLFSDNPAHSLVAICLPTSMQVAQGASGRVQAVSVPLIACFCRSLLKLTYVGSKYHTTENILTCETLIKEVTDASKKRIRREN
jgi:hypothetical protein